MAGENHINHERPCHSPQWLPTALRESSLPQIIHRSHKSNRFHSLPWLIHAPSLGITKQICPHFPKSADTNHDLHLAKESAALSITFILSSPTPGDLPLFRDDVEMCHQILNLLWLSISPTSLAICRSRTDGSIHIPSDRKRARVGEGHYTICSLCLVLDKTSVLSDIQIQTPNVKRKKQLCSVMWLSHS